MFSLINAERKRILPKKIVIFFLLFLLIYTGYGTYQSLKHYEIWGNKGVSVSAKDNLNYTKDNTKNKWMGPEYMKSLRDGPFVHRYLDRVNMDSLCYINYGERVLRDLSDQDFDQFYQNRLAIVKTTIESSNYTKEEKNGLMKKENQYKKLSMGYAEGWKNLNTNLGAFIKILFIVTVVLLLPVFGNDSGIKMEELCRTTKKGKRSLDMAKLSFAYLAGIMIYVIGNLLYFVIRMTPFGLEGAKEPIQNSRIYFYSFHHITYLKQYAINLFLGFLAMIFVISFTLLTAILVRQILAGGLILVFAGGCLMLMEQMNNSNVDHLFANFLPLKMIDFPHYYLGSEMYRIFGNSMSTIQWTAIVSLSLSIVFFIFIVICSGKMQKKGRR